MGCDIHAAIEAREFGRWRFKAEPDTGRFYEFFAFLAGVRGRYDGEGVLAARRGLPPDADEFTGRYVNGDHSDSWCTLAEFKAFLPTVASESTPWLREDGEPSAVARWRRWIAMAEMVREQTYDATDEDVRFVFNFDS